MREYKMIKISPGGRNDKLVWNCHFDEFNEEKSFQYNASPFYQGNRLLKD
jgi:hypothetical protein